MGEIFGTFLFVVLLTELSSLCLPSCSSFVSLLSLILRQTDLIVVSFSQKSESIC